MPCILPDGSVTPTAKKVLAVASEAKSAEEIAQATGMPLYRVRSSVRELLEGGLLQEREGKYQITEKGKEKI